MAPEKNYNWSHQAGDWCFERIIVPSVELKQAAPVQ
jgi:hypothetical protein